MIMKQTLILLIALSLLLALASCGRELDEPEVFAIDRYPTFDHLREGVWEKLLAIIRSMPGINYLGYGSEARINVPGIAEDNWNWKLLSGKTTPELAKEIWDLTHTFGRCWDDK